MASVSKGFAKQSYAVLAVCGQTGFETLLRQASFVLNGRFEVSSIRPEALPELPLTDLPWSLVFLEIGNTENHLEKLKALRQSQALQLTPIIAVGRPDHSKQLICACYRAGTNCFFRLQPEQAQEQLAEVMDFWLNVARLPHLVQGA